MTEAITRGSMVSGITTPWVAAIALLALAMTPMAPIHAQGSMNAETWTETTTINGRTASVTYSRASRSIISTSPEGRQSTTLLDSFGRPIEERVSGIEPVRTSYDVRGRVERVEQGPADAARSSIYSYDAQGYVASVTDPLLRTVQLQHDAVGRVTKQILPDLREISFAYDASGNLASVTPPSRPPHAFAYTPVDQLGTYTPPDVVIGTDSTTYSYNRDRQITQVTRPDGQTLDLGYDFAGRASTLTTPSGTTTYHYNVTTGHLDSIAAPAGGGSLAYQRDGALITGITQSGPVPAQVVYTYDRAPDDSSNFWIVARTIDGNGPTAVAYEYDDDGLMTRAGPLQLHRDTAKGLLLGTNLAKTGDRIERTSFGEIQRYQAGFDDLSCSGFPPPFAGCRLVFEQTFARDAAGRIRQKMEFLRAPLTNEPAQVHIYDYTFDSAGRLTEVERDGAVWETYGYDANSNRTAWTDPWGTGAATYDAQDRLLTYGNRAYTYTANGELRTKTQGGQTVTYTYDPLGNLKTVDLPIGIAVDYVVDVHNRRIGKKVNGSLIQRFVYGTGMAPLAEQDSGGVLVSTFIYGSKGNVPDLLLRDGKTYRIVADHLGSVRWVLDAENGVVAQRLDYDVFGRVMLDSNPGFQPFGFAGGLYDHQTGLVRFGARDYDAEIGRWTAKDPILFGGGDMNLFGYVFNDPINMTDPSGHVGLADAPKWYVGGVDVAAHFWAGFGDSASFGATGLVRGWTGAGGAIDRTNGWYATGQWTDVGAELMLTLGSSVLKRAAAKVPQAALRAEARQITRNIQRNGSVLHHLNPLKGHPGGAGTMFPTAGLPAWLHSGGWNVRLMSRAAHTAAHHHLRALEDAVAIAFHPGVTAARGVRNATEACGCQ